MTYTDLADLRGQLEEVRDAARLLAEKHPQGDAWPADDLARLERCEQDAGRLRGCILAAETTDRLEGLVSNDRAGQRQTRPMSGAVLSPHRGASQGTTDSFAARLFGERPRPDQNFPTLAKFCREVHLNPSRMAEMTLTEGDGPGGGYAVPSQLAFELFDRMYAAGLVWPRCKLVPMSSNSISLWGFNGASAASNTLYGGISTYWVTEGQAATPQDPALRAVNIRAVKMMLLARSSIELVADAGPEFEAQLGAALIQAGSWALDDAILNGVASGPLGILNSPCKVAVAKEGSQTNYTVNSTNIFKMWTRLHPSCASNAVWLCNPDVLPQLFQMVVAGASSDVPVFLPAGQGYSAMAGAPAMTLMGRPLIVTDHCQTVGTEGDIVLADLTQYALGMRRQFGIESSAHESFSSGLINWRMICRVGGQPLWDRPYTPANGTDELSCIVTLADRK